MSDTVSTEQLKTILAGGDSYIRTKNGEVKGLAITIKKNPEAPEVIVVGTGPRIIANANLFTNSNTYVPVYLKKAVNEWKFLGNFKAKEFNTSAEVIEKHRKHRLKKDVSGILYLTASDEVEVTVKGGKRFPNQETKKLIELAAIEAVTAKYIQTGYSVKDCQKDNCGYDLLVEKAKEILKIEVKGTSLVDQHFFITRNENARSIDPHWRLAIVTESLTKPNIEIFSAEEMKKKFDFDALCWECTPKTT